MSDDELLIPEQINQNEEELNWKEFVNSSEESESHTAFSNISQNTDRYITKLCSPIIVKQLVQHVVYAIQTHSRSLFSCNILRNFALSSDENFRFVIEQGATKSLFAAIQDCNNLITIETVELFGLLSLYDFLTLDNMVVSKKHLTMTQVGHKNSPKAPVSTVLRYAYNKLFYSFLINKPNSFHIQLMKSLLDYNKSQNVKILDAGCWDKNNAKFLPVHIASSMINDTDLVIKIIENNESSLYTPDPNWGRLPLHYAVLHRNLPLVSYMVKALGELLETKNIDLKILDVNFQSPYNIAKHLGYDDCIQILKSNSSYWMEEMKRLKEESMIILQQLQDLSLNVINTFISEKIDTYIEEFLHTEPTVIEVYLTKLCNSVIQDESNSISRESRIVEAFAAIPKHREYMNVEAIIKVASKRYFHTISCFENGYFSVPNKDHLISIFEQRELFQYVNINPSEEKLPKIASAAKRPESGYSVVSKEVFLDNFKAFTANIFDGFDFSNTIVLGGCVSACLLPANVGENQSKSSYYLENTKYEGSDIDIYLYGLTTKQEVVNKIQYIFRFLHNKYSGKITVVKTPITVSFIGEYPRRVVQVIAKPFFSIASIVSMVDLESTAVCFDGNNVWACPRAVVAFNYKINVVSLRAHTVRGSPQYEGRLLKYFERGYSIVDMGIRTYGTNVDEYKDYDFETLLWPKEARESVKEGFYKTQGYLGQPVVTGYWLLLLAAKYPAVYRLLQSNEKSVILPFGPETTRKDIVALLGKGSSNIGRRSRRDYNDNRYVVLPNDWNMVHSRLNDISWQSAGYLLKAKNWETILNSFRKSPRDDTWYLNKLKN